MSKERLAIALLAGATGCVSPNPTGGLEVTAGDKSTTLDAVVKTPIAKRVDAFARHRTAAPYEENGPGDNGTGYFTHTGVGVQPFSGVPVTVRAEGQAISGQGLTPYGTVQYADKLGPIRTILALRTAAQEDPAWQTQLVLGSKPKITEDLALDLRGESVTTFTARDHKATIARGRAGLSYKNWSFGLQADATWKGKNKRPDKQGGFYIRVGF